MKKLLAIFVMLLSIFTFAGCKKTVELKEVDDNRWLKLSYDNDTFILVDKETNVCYLFEKFGYGAGLAVMVDKDGKPLLYKGE